MNWTEKEKLKAIFNCIAEAYKEIDRATDDRKADIEKVFGTATNPEWAPEDHIHLSSGQIVDIELLECGGFIFSPERWRNTFGEQISGIFSPKHYDDKNKLRNSIHFCFFEGKFQWTCEVGFCNAYYSNKTDYPIKVSEEVIHWMIDNFNVEKIRENTFALRNARTKREFGLAYKSSYFETKPLKEPKEGDKATNYQAEATYSILKEDD